MDQDAQNYNFDKMDRFYMLNYIGPGAPKEMNIIGATSPATLFFSSANDLSYVSDNIQLSDKPFDEDYCPLYKRDHDFIIYLYAFRKNCQNFATLFPEVYTYMESTYSKLGNEMHDEILQLTPQSISAYEQLQYVANSVEILGHPLHKRIVQDRIMSDFEIDSTIYAGKKPLVLPVEAGNNYTSFKYTQRKWGSLEKAPFYDDRDLDRRTLPQDGAEYGYVTISDFLEDTIIRISERRSDFKSESFYDGSREETIKESYLLPVKPFFFQFFTADDLRGEKNGQKMFEFLYSPSGVMAIIRIPVVGGKNIEYRRTYFKPGTTVDLKRNQGAMRHFEFGLALYPNTRFNTDAEAYYRVALARPFDSVDLKIQAYKSSEAINPTHLVRNTTDTIYKRSEVFAIDGMSFDYLQLQGDKCQGLIVPLFANHTLNSQFTFAIDLGTTNTNVEYRINSEVPKPFDINVRDMQLHPLAEYEKEYLDAFETDIVPSLIGTDSRYLFPIRTALSYSRQVNWKNKVTPIAEANVAFTYERMNEFTYNEIRTNLKWSNDPTNSDMLKCYIESLFMLMRNKVVLNNGSLSQTKIVWFYPISMSQNRLNLFKQTWASAYKKYFGGTESNVVEMTESIAPYEYFKAMKAQSSNTVTVDIGGETTDIVFADEGKVQCISSFRFAANTIFGDGYSDPSYAVQNGIVAQFKDSIALVLKDTKQSELYGVYQDINKRNNSAEIASFLFSLKTNRTLLDNNRFNIDTVDFTHRLQLDDKQKIVFLFFYVAIIYHIANIMKAKQMSMPRYIAFSGNGSKVLSVLSDNDRQLAKFTKTIFEQIYNQAYDTNGLDIIRHNNPKQATCEGGLTGYDKAIDLEDLRDCKVVLKGLDNKTFVTNETYGDIKKTSNYVQIVEAEAKQFVDFVLGLNKSFNFSDNFGISSQSIGIAEAECKRDLATYTKNGIELKLKEVSEESRIEETLFFYPIVGMLSNLANKIYESVK